MKHEQKMRLISSWYDDESILSTEFRRLYSKIRHLNPNKDVKNFLVTSATLGEGKSTAASLLAMTIAKYRNTNTLLIDCDLRRPMIYKLFGLPQEKGLVDVLLGKNKLKSVIKKSFISNLSILTGGELSSTPSEILNLPNLKDFFTEIKFYFDTIIIDSPPTIPVSDTLILSTEVDGAIIIIKAGKTPRELIKRATDLMRDSGINILGIILNNVKDVLPYYYKDQYNSYKYQINIKS